MMSLCLRLAALCELSLHTMCMTLSAFHYLWSKAGVLNLYCLVGLQRLSKGAEEPPRVLALMPSCQTSMQKRAHRGMPSQVILKINKEWPYDETVHYEQLQHD